MRGNSVYIFIAVLASILFLSLPIIFSPDLNKPGNLFTVRPFLRDFVAHFLLLGFFYLNFLVLVPQFYFRRKYVVLAILLIVCFLAVIYMPQLVFPDIKPATGNFPGSRKWLFRLNNRFFVFLLMFFLGLMIRINMKLKKSEQERVNAELSYLKAQINPHFLFNTLNSIYALALEKTDAAAEALVKLSGMMRYVFTDASAHMVPLEAELAYLKDYVELQRLRLTERVKLSFSIIGDPAGKYVSPVILIVFIENAFKHGVNTEADANIVIQAEITNQSLELTVTNSVFEAHHESVEKTGLGIINTRSRLELLYPGKHQLKIQQTAEKFSVHLKLIF